MKYSELSLDVQEQLKQDRIELSKTRINTAYEVELYNATGTRFFIARRICKSWNDDKGNAMPFGGGTYWQIKYGCVQFCQYHNPFGETDFKLKMGKTYTSSLNGTVIPKQLSTKKEVLALIKQIGIFTI